MISDRKIEKLVWAGALAVILPFSYLIYKDFQHEYRTENSPASQAGFIPRPTEGYTGDLATFASRFSNADQIHDCLMGLNKGRSDKQIYDVNDYWASTRRVLEIGDDDCDGGTLVGMSLVRRVLDRKANFLFLSNPEEPIAHAVTLYTDDEGNYCTLGIRAVDRKDGFKTLKDLIVAFGYKQCAVLTDKDLGQDWETTDRNISRSFSVVKIEDIDEAGIRFLFEE